MTDDRSGSNGPWNDEGGLDKATIEVGSGPPSGPNESSDFLGFTFRLFVAAAGCLMLWSVARVAVGSKIEAISDAAVWGVGFIAIGMTLGIALLLLAGLANAISLPEGFMKKGGATFVASILGTSAGIYGGFIKLTPTASGPKIEQVVLLKEPTDRKTIIQHMSPKTLEPRAGNTYFQDELGILAVAVVSGVSADDAGNYKVIENFAIYNDNIGSGQFGSKVVVGHLDFAKGADPSRVEQVRRIVGDLKDKVLLFLYFYGDEEAGKNLGIRELTPGSNTLWLEVVDSKTGKASEPSRIPVVVSTSTSASG